MKMRKIDKWQIMKIRLEKMIENENPIRKQKSNQKTKIQLENEYVSNQKIQFENGNNSPFRNWKESP